MQHAPGNVEEAEDTAFGAADATYLGKAEEAEDTALWAGKALAEAMTVLTS